MFRIVFLLGLLALSVLPAPASARSLYWDPMHVTARLDRDGRLHVVESQGYVFTGAWNGGERTFNIRPGQSLSLRSLTRIDPATGERRAVQWGYISELDRYNWFNGHRTLRWRSRLPSDPPFDRTRITYELEYTLSNILMPEGDGTYVLNHDFAFPDRPGPILHYSLDLELDPSWQPVGSLPLHVEKERLEPGEAVVLRAALRHIGPGRPAAVIYGASRPFRLILVLVAFSFILCRTLILSLRDVRRGRFASLLPPEMATRSWVEKNILSLPPEVVGAAWDNATSSAEVAAVLARMVQEGKLTSSVETKSGIFFKRPVLHLELKTDRETLPDYEKALVGALFVFDSTKTDTDSVRAYYREALSDPARKLRGYSDIGGERVSHQQIYYQKNEFDPADKIRGPLEARVRSLAGHGDADSKGSRVPSLLLLAAGGFTTYIGLSSHSYELHATLFALLCFFATYIAAAIAAALYRTSITAPGGRFLSFFLLVIVMAAGFAWFVLYQRPNVSVATGVGILLCLLSLCNSVFNQALSGEDAERIALRKTLAAGRAFMRRELHRSVPHMEDSWYPYLLAYGLGPEVDRWFKAFGGVAGTSSGSSFSSGGQGALSGSAAGGFSGGGGLFGGGGASGSWAAAAGGMASSVSAPSSSGGSGGGGGGSGGGGGGGW